MNVTIWYNANLVTMDSEKDYEIIERGALVIEQNKIAWLGEEKALPKYYQKEATYINAKNRFITPGLIDCHTHLVYAGNRARDFENRLKGKTYSQIAHEGGGIHDTISQTRAASFDDLYDLSLSRVHEMIQNGVTTIEIKSGYGQDFDTELKQLKVIEKLKQSLPLTFIATYLGAHLLPNEFVSNRQYLDFCIKQVMPELHSMSLIDMVDGFCENMAFKAQELEPYYLKAREYGLPIKLHAEQFSEAGACALAAQLKAVSVDHLEYLSEENVALLKKNDITAVILPGAYYFLNETQKPPIPTLTQQGVPIAIATDCNPGTSPTTSMLLMLNMACVLWGLTPLQALQGATIYAAKALGLSDRKGRLKVGYDADVVCWKISHPNELSYFLGSSLCEKVMANGCMVYEKN